MRPTDRPATNPHYPSHVGFVMAPPISFLVVPLDESINHVNVLHVLQLTSRKMAHAQISLEC
jgi:hypothetical protein